MYSCEDGFANDWHLVHLGSRACGGAGLVMVEATAVTPEGRISPADMGIWSDHHVEPLARIARFVAGQGAVPGIQLAHAGRKAGTKPPWTGGGPVQSGAWTPLAPSPIPFDDHYLVPAEMTPADIDGVVRAFVAAAGRAVRAGFQVVEIHSAHGYLLHQFLSPLSNHRKDSFGGSFENRVSLVEEVSSRLRSSLPAGYPLFIRISTTDWMEGGWDVDQSVALARRLKSLGVDLVDASSGGTSPKAAIPLAKGYQVPAAARIRRESGILTGAVGMITEIDHANEIVTGGSADLVFLAREFLREPYWGLKAQEALGKEPSWPIQYGYAVKRRSR
jgi:2,4-dienoyl-CoA reductase-like NADH-dependent reductase (Old Yellow Enzyme family)